MAENGQIAGQTMDRLQGKGPNRKLVKFNILVRKIIGLKKRENVYYTLQRAFYGADKGSIDANSKMPARKIFHKIMKKVWKLEFLRIFWKF